MSLLLRIPRLVSSYRLDLRNSRAQDYYCAPEQTRAHTSNFLQPVSFFPYIYKYHLRSYHGSVRRMSVVTLAVWSLPRTALPEDVVAWKDSAEKRVMTLIRDPWALRYRLTRIWYKEKLPHSTGQAVRRRNANVVRVPWSSKIELRTTTGHREWLSFSGVGYRKR